MINDSHSNEIDFEERLSPHFTVGEMMRSGKAVGMGIKNVPEVNPAPGEASREEVIENLRELCRCVLEPLRRRVGRVIVVGGYRCEAVNRAVHGAEHSQHMRGEAVDIHVTGLEMCRKYAAILSQTDFDQMILEPQESIKKRWIHISYRRDGKNRHQILGAK
jgi:peptidase M15